MPPNLVLHLKRFESDLRTGATRKLRSSIDIDPELSLMSQPDLSPDDPIPHQPEPQPEPQPEHTVEQCHPLAAQTYRLRALVTHHGESCSSGHYTCVARLADSDQWVSYDDTHVELVQSDLTNPGRISDACTPCMPCTPSQMLTRVLI